MKYEQRDIVEINFMFPDGTTKPHPAFFVSAAMGSALSLVGVVATATVSFFVVLMLSLTAAVCALANAANAKSAMNTAFLMSK